jgi:fibronectin-binding autotransporter adhesin
MNGHCSGRMSGLVLVAILALGLAATVGAGNLYYDVIPGTAAIDGGTANWGDSNWKTTAGGTTGGAWADGNAPYFEPIVGSPSTTTVTIGGTVTTGFGGVHFDGPGYTITGGTLNLVNDWFYVGSNARVESSLTQLHVVGDGELTINGTSTTVGGGTFDGRVVLGASNWNSHVRQIGGSVTIPGDYLMIGGNGTGVTNARGEYILDAGTITVGGGMYLGWNASSNYGTFTQNGGTVETQTDGQGLQLGISGGHGTYNLNGGTLYSTFNVVSPGSEDFNFGGGTYKARASTSTWANMTTTILAGKIAYIDTNGKTVNWNGVISGAAAAGLTVSSSAANGILCLNAANTYAGVTTINSGSLWLGNGTANGSVAGDIVINDAAAYLRLQRTGSYTVSNNISGPGYLIMGLGTATLSGNSSFGGGTFVNNGTLKLGTDTALGTGSVTVLGPNTTASQLDLNGRTIANQVILNYEACGGAGAPGALINSSATLAVINGPVALGGNNYVGNAGDVTINGVISGGFVGGNDYAILKQGTGTWTLANPANTYNGYTYVAGGTLAVTKMANLNEPSSLGQPTQASVDYVKFFGSGGTLKYIGSTASTSDRTFVLGGTANNILDASGTSASATLTLTGAASAPSAGARTFTLTGTNTGANTYQGIISNGSGTVSVLKTGTGTWVLGGANTYGGTTTINGGVLRLNNASALPGTPLTINSGVLELQTPSTFARSLGNTGTTVQITGGTSGFSAYGSPASINLNGAHGTIQWGSTYFQPSILVLNEATATAGLDFQNTLDLNAATRTINVNANIATISYPVVNNGGGSAGLTKGGPGTLSLAAANTYNGPTTVNAGTLEIPLGGSVSATSSATINAGTLLVGLGGSLTTAGGVSVLGGTLDVRGTVNAAVTASGTGVVKGTGMISALTLDPGGVVAPGLSPGTLNAGNTIWNGGGIYNWEVNNFQGTAGSDPGWDLLNITGTLTINAIPGNPFILDLDTLQPSDNTPGLAAGALNLYQLFEIAQASDGILGFDTATFTFDTTGFFNTLSTNPFWVVRIGNSLYLEQVPEPTALSLLALGGLAILRRRRKN